MMSMRMLAGAVAASLTLFPALSAKAEDGWHGKVVPYLWAAGIDGNATVAGRDVDVNVGFGDILDKTDIGGSLLALVNHDQLVFLGQVDYLDLSDSGTSPGGINAKLDSTSTIGTLAVGWRVQGGNTIRSMDLLIGARQLSLDNKLTVDGLGSVQGDHTFTDAVVIAVPRFPLSDRWSFNPILSYGSGDSKSVWEIWPQLRYTVAKSWDAHIGYRQLHYDLEGDRGNKLDASLNGATVGIGYVF